MEHCPGATLEARVREKGPLGLAEGIDVLVQASRGLAAVHAVGVVHRDVKPSNLMLLPDGTVKVTDFGLSKSLSGDVMATAGRIMGTPAYMSPEQVRGKPVDARTDIYLLGLTAHFVFTGKPAWASEAVGEVIHDQLSTPLPSVTEGREDLPPALDDALALLCAKEPAQRPATMQEVARLFEGLRPRPIDPAPFLARAVAYAVDFGVVMGLGLAVWVLLGVGAWATGSVAEVGPFLSGTTAMMAFVLAMLVASVLVSVFAERRFGTSPGKLLLGMGVVRADGTPPGLRALVLRYLLKYPVFLAVFPSHGFSWADLAFWILQGLAVMAGVLCYFFSHGRTLSDRITGTRVVYRLRGGGRTRP